MLDRIADKARHAAQGAAIGAVATIFVLLGLGFLAASLWIVLARAEDALFANLVIGCGAVGIGLLLFALLTLRGRPRRRVPPPPQTDIAAVIAAFRAGMDAGKSAKR